MKIPSLLEADLKSDMFSRQSNPFNLKNCVLPLLLAWLVVLMFHQIRSLIVWKPSIGQCLSIRRNAVHFDPTGRA